VQDETVRAAQQSLDITLNQYSAGIATYLQVVVTQAVLLQAQTAALGIRGGAWRRRVLLVKALGGGWEKALEKGVRHIRFSRAECVLTRFF
jgi:outer membrane protein TolC